MRRIPGLLIFAALTAGGLVGCGKPNAANIVLRKDNQKLLGKINELERQHAADTATIAGLTQRTGTTPTLDPQRLQRLFTVHEIVVQRLTGGADLDPSKPGDEGVKVYVGLLDQHGDELKSSGSFAVDAFDLAEAQAQRLGHWEFPIEQAQANWHSFLTRYEYVLTCPWETPPTHPDVTVRVTFNDELTGRQFTAQRVVKVRVPPATQPSPSATRPAQASTAHR